MTPSRTHFFPAAHISTTETWPLPRPFPARPLPRFPANPAPVTRLGPATSPRRRSIYPLSRHPTTLGTPRPYRLPRRPLRIADLCGGMVTGLETLLKAGCAIAFYARGDIDPDMHAAISHRLPRMPQLYPQLLPHEASLEWDSLLPLDTRSISPKILLEALPKGIDFKLASPSMLTKHLPITHRDHMTHGPVIIHHIA